MGEALPIIVTIIVSLGGGAGIRELFVGIGKLRGGMSGRENKRKLDIIQQRDEAYGELDAYRDLVRRVQINRASLREYAASQRFARTLAGTPVAQLEPWPQLESEELHWPPTRINHSTSQETSS